MPQTHATTRLFVLIVFLCGLFGGFVSFCKPALPKEEQLKQRFKDHPSFIGTQKCGSCHQTEMNHWQGSDHDLAMGHATSETVLADFNNATFEYYGTQSRFFKQDSSFYVETIGSSGAKEVFKVRYTFGVDPLQQYLVDIGDGKIQCLPFAWDTEKKQWFHLYPDEEITYTDALFWTKRYQNWNYMCASCHTTNYQKNYDAELDQYQSTWTEINVGCEACHGPGENHLIWANEIDSLTTYDWKDAGLTNRLNTMEQIGFCAPCHARRSDFDDWDHTSSFNHNYTAQLPVDPFYHVDGQIKDEDYVYASFKQSKMAHANIKCSDCHDAHQLQIPRPVAITTCNNCHPAATYNTENHHKHKKETASAVALEASISCIDCHMPQSTYMIIDERADHSIRIPRPDLSITLGSPNACTQNCHQAETDKWAAEAITKWYPEGDSIRKAQPHYGELFKEVQSHKKEIIAYLEDVQKPAILRATALDKLLNEDPPAVQQKLYNILVTNYPNSPTELITTALSIARFWPEEERYTILKNALNDSLKSVRILAMEALSDFPKAKIEGLGYKDLYEEYIQYLKEHADMPGGRMNLASFYQRQANISEAIKEYQKAIQMEASFVDAYLVLSVIYSSQTNKQKAESILLEALKQQPKHSDVHYALALVYSENPTDYNKAIHHYKQSSNARAFYNLALIYYKQGNQIEAIKAAQHYLDNHPNNEEAKQLLDYICK